jgi:hypothetical protein
MEESIFGKIVKDQIEVGKFLESFDPVLMPFESTAKYGIVSASAYFGISCALFKIFSYSIIKENGYDWLLFCSWVLFLGSFVFGGLELFRTLTFRDQMRKFSYVLLGDKLNDHDKNQAMNNIKKSYLSAVVLELIFLATGIGVFIFWVLLRILK